MTDSSNPLLAVEHPIRFDAVRAEHVGPAIDKLLADARAKLEVFERDEITATYDGTMTALEDVTEMLGRAMGVVGHLEAVATSDALRDAYNEAQPKVSAFLATVPTSAGAWRALQAFAASDEARDLDPIRARFLRKTIEWFEREGARLDDAGKAKLRKLDVELSELCTKFGQNVLDATNAWDLVIEERDRLAGLPDRVIAAARANAQRKGVAGYRFTLQAPSFVPVMTYLDDAGVREQVYRAYHTRASRGAFDNREVVGRILALRKQKAELLGYGDFVDLVLADRMAKSGAKAREFVADLERRSRATFEREQRELQAFRQELQGPDAPALQPWDVGYYAEKQRTARYAFDEEAVRAYLPLESVLDGLFELLHRLYGIRVEATDLPVWHASVRAYRVSDADGALLGHCYADLFPREEKRDGAWMGGFITGEPTAGGDWTPHVGVVCANITPPVGETPSLLSHREMETLFHEFGHLMHHMLSRVPVRSLAGTQVAWDFVELPSQIMENFCWEKDVLDLFARHHETGEPIPADLFDAMLRARSYRGASAMMRQLGFATLDLELHMQYDAARDGDVVAYGRRILERFTPGPLPTEHSMATSFGHLFGSPVGYAGGYYSYKWAEVLDADAFDRFREEGLLGSEVGRAFREHVLARGDGDDPMALFRAFRGREPRIEPLLERTGIAAE